VQETWGRSQEEMESSGGERYIALDHVRALAALMVISWHFIHGFHGYPVPFAFAPSIFPLALLDEGHTGVALFMTLSGYLFAKLLDKKSLNYVAFLRNRVLRLAPLLVLVSLIVGIRTYLRGEDLLVYLLSVSQGLLYPTLPNGGWSITVEFHFYILLPLLLWMLRISSLNVVLIVALAVLLRYGLYHQSGEVQILAYQSLVGRIDQFVLGMAAFQMRSHLFRRHVLVLLILLSFGLFYWYFDYMGGFFKSPAYPSTNPLWIVLPTIEGAAYAVAIAWYETSFKHERGKISAWIAQAGSLSYSMYLLHFFIVFEAARFVNERIMPITNFYLACLWSFIFYLSMIPISFLSFRYVESPFLRRRSRYAISGN
jgi:peptidoglycan/LPS O-acetylase OafA/YrhL